MTGASKMDDTNEDGGSSSGERPNTDHLGPAFATLKLGRSELTIWQQDSWTYPFLWHITQGDESGFAAGCALIDSEDFEYGEATIESVRVLQHMQSQHIILSRGTGLRYLGFLSALVFAAAAVEHEDDGAEEGPIPVCENFGYAGHEACSEDPPLVPGVDPTE
jgi:hypothetical protein